MWIVALALRRPYTFIVMALVILLLTPVALLRTPTDIFPDINIPVISIIWNYNGLSAAEMATRITYVNERGITTSVNDIEHIESQSLNGVSVIKIFFRPEANLQTAMAQVTAMSQTSVRNMPPGATPPSAPRARDAVRRKRRGCSRGFPSTGSRRRGSPHPASERASSLAFP